jgi:hypothetical protein
MDNLMRHDNNSHKNEQGAALIATLMFLMAMGVLSTALIFSVLNEMKTSAAYKYGQQSFYVANGGVQKAVNWFASSYTPHLPAADYDLTTLPVKYSGNDVLLAGQTGSTSVYPEGSVISAFSSEFNNKSLQADSKNSGAYSLNATLLKYSSVRFIDPTTFISYPSAMERWRLNSIGNWGTSSHPLGTAQVTAVIENSGNALFDRALWGIDSVDLGGTVLIDSYDPALGAYGGANIGNNGGIGSNGSVTATGSVDINGDMAYGPTGTYSIGGTSTVSGNIVHLSQPRYFPSIPSFTVGTTNYNPRNGTITLNPGSYGDIAIGANGILALNPGVYYFNSITEAASASLTITGDTTIFVKSDLDLSGQGVLNSTGDPTKLTVYYSGTNEAKIAGGASAFIEAYAPNAPLRFVGTSDFFGSFIGKTVTIQGTPEVHFDEGCLQDHLFHRAFRLITWSQDSY